MTIPTLLFAAIVASLYGAVYHFLRGGGFWRLVLYLFLSNLGFAIGHLVAVWRGWSFFPLGSLFLGMSTIGSVVILLVGDWLSRIDA